MKSVSLKNLVDKLSKIGFDFWPGKTNSVSTDIGELCSTLLKLKGEASSVAIAEEIISCYQTSTSDEKLTFFEFLFEELTADRSLIDEAIKDYQQSKSQQHIQILCRAAESPRQDLFRALNMAPNGTQSLITLREDLLAILPDHSALKAIDEDLLHLFKSWFNRGFLQLKKIDWHTPAEVLEKLIEYDSVHEIQGWPDLRRRLEADRRCFGFFHPVMPNDPLIFVEVALTRELNANIADLINQQAPEKNHPLNANTAVFYSINNCFAGLAGVSFGNFLIKQVVENLAADIPEVTTYSTLSPVPDYLSWLGNNLESLSFLTEDEGKKVDQYLQGNIQLNELEATLLQLCAYYLLKAKSKDKPFDSVARFHLGNGAELQRINWQADLSDNGIKQSAGIMVNYLYDRKALTRNHEAYEQNHKVICSKAVSKLLP